MNTIFTAITLAIILLLHHPTQTADALPSWVYLDFDTAMLRTAYQKSVALTSHVVGIDGNTLLDFSKDLYNKNHPSKMGISETVRIPKIIHQIWIGGPVPDAFKQFMQSWTETHLGPEWQYFLWTDDNVHQVKLYNQHFYDISENPGIKSDLLKWELIYQFGGVYVDMDFECLKSIETLHYQYDFYTGFQPLDTQYVQLGAALFGARPGHPILKHCIETIKDDWGKHGIPAKTGPIHFTRSFYAMAGKDALRDIALPAYYFYPLGCIEKNLDYDAWLKNGAFAVHHWAKSWMPPSYRQPQFKTLNNDAATLHWND